jgi:GMP synthase (glutamine-hydrolysing)
MTEDRPQPQVTVLDAGGQYCHLIARRVREMGVYADVMPSETPAAELAGRKAVIVSGGPSSVYESGSPTADPALFSAGVPVLGICYGLQLMAHLMNGRVKRGAKGEYGHARIHLTGRDRLFEGLDAAEDVWMSHRDQVETPPPGFALLASTPACPVAAMGDAARRLYGIQFHPEVVHTPKGQRLLENFVFGVAGCVKDWDPRGRLALLEEKIREAAAGRHVFFFVSGGVDSSVAYTLCLRALGPERVRGAYVDTGLMREGETDFVRDVFTAMSPETFRVVDASADFLEALKGAVEPERKRHIIGEMFVQVQDRVLRTGHYLDADWILGQGTIYPDTIESGGTAKADLIKTHHNRVAGIQKLIDENRIIEPLTSFYKDEVRAIGRELGLPAEMLDRHPFPGPGLAIRLLCSDGSRPVTKIPEGWLLPVHSVGVQGDSRSYRAALALDHVSAAAMDRAAETINSLSAVNRVVGLAGSHARLDEMTSSPAHIDAQRLARLRRADAIVRGLSHESGFDRKVWQFPVVVIPVGTAGRPDSVVLRPVDSIDGMTAQAVAMERGLLERITRGLLEVPGICAVFYDLTHKPPGTIEWE